MKRLFYKLNKKEINSIFNFYIGIHAVFLVYQFSITAIGSSLFLSEIITTFAYVINNLLLVSGTIL